MFLSGAVHNRFADRVHPGNAAVMVIDGQVGIARGLDAVLGGRVLNNLVGLAKVARLYGLPSLLAVSEPAGVKGAALPELLDLAGSAALIERAPCDIVEDPRLRAMLQAFGRSHLILAGLTAAPLLVETALGAVRQGYEVHVVLDASTENESDVSQVSIARLTAAGIDLTTWVAILAELAAHGANKATERDVQAAVQAHLACYTFAGSFAFGFDEGVLADPYKRG